MFRGARVSESSGTLSMSGAKVEIHHRQRADVFGSRWTESPGRAGSYFVAQKLTVCVRSKREILARYRLPDMTPSFQRRGGRTCRFAVVEAADPMSHDV